MIEILKLPSIRVSFLMMALALSFAHGWTAWAQHQDKAEFYQKWFQPAVTVACGKGYLDISSEKKNVVTHFLQGQTTSIDCVKAFSEENAIVTAPPHIFQLQTVSLQYLTAGLWRTFGFNWDVMRYLAGFLVAGTALGGFFLARFFLSYWPSLIFSILIGMGNTFSDLQIVQIRDFSKAPFVIALTSFAMGIMFARREFLPWLAIGAGITVSIGIGFRTDISLFLVLIPVAFLIKLIVGKDRRVAIFSIFLFAITAFLIDFLILDYTAAMGRNTAHFAVLGRYLGFIQSLGFLPGASGTLQLYNDSVAWGVTSLFEIARGNAAPAFATPEYDDAGRAFLLRYAMVFPADSFQGGLTAALIATFNFLGGNIVFFVAFFVATIVAAKYRWRALAFYGLVLAIGGVTFVQFSRRHIFHMEIFGFLLILLVAIILLEVIWSFFVRRLRPEWELNLIGGRSAPADGRLSTAFALSIVAAALLSAVTLQALRYWQGRQIAGELERIDAMPRRDLPASAEPNGAQTDYVVDGRAVDRTGYMRIDLAGSDAGIPEPCRGTVNLSTTYETVSDYHRWDFQQTFPPYPIQTAYFVLPKADENELNSIRVSVPSNCRPRLALVRPTQPFLPLTFFRRADGGVEPFRNRFFTKVISAVANYYTRLTTKEKCLIEGLTLSGGARAAELREALVLPEFIRIRVNEGDGGINSDHLDVVRPLLTIGGTSVRLSDLPITVEQEGSYPHQINKTIVGRPLTLNGREFDWGIGMHAPTTIRFEIPAPLIGQTAELSMAVGIDDETAGAGSVSLDLCLSE